MSLVQHVPESFKVPWRRFREWRFRRTPFWRTYAPQASLIFTDPRIIINHERKFIYFRVPKAANSTVMATLYACDTGKVISSGSLFQAKVEYYDHPSDLTAQQVRDLDGYTAFTIVRHPVKRLVSAYRNKIAGKKPPSFQVFRSLGRDPASQDISLEEFVTYLESGGLDKDPHWIPQRHYLPGGFRRLDEIGRVESLDVDLKRILGRLYPQGFQIVDFRPHATGADKAAVDPATARRIAALYAEDFAVLGYQADPVTT